jgi:hypothetical protein
MGHAPQWRATIHDCSLSPKHLDMHHSCRHLPCTGPKLHLWANLCHVPAHALRADSAVDCQALTQQSVSHRALHIKQAEIQLLYAGRKKYQIRDSQPQARSNDYKRSKRTFVTNFCWTFSLLCTSRSIRFCRQWPTTKGAQILRMEKVQVRRKVS